MSFHDFNTIVLIVSTTIFIGITVKELVKIRRGGITYRDKLQKYADAIRNGESPPSLH